MQRPFTSSSIDDLEAAFEQANDTGDTATLELIAYELEFRKTPRARELRETVGEMVRRGMQPEVTARQRPIPSSQLAFSLPPAASDVSTSTKSSKKARAGGKVASKHPPTPEQAEAIGLFEKGGSLKINAYAGTGKTSTLEMLAHSTTRRGQYLAFNRDIIAEARQRFPKTVNCSTTHGLAYKTIAGQYGGNSDKLTGRMNANQLAEVLGLKYWRIDKDHALRPRSQGFLILDTIRRFAMSADPEPLPIHVPHHGALRAAPEETRRTVCDFAVRGAKSVWERMRDAGDPLPLGHDGYLKLWALSNPVIAADYILMDEAQDTNPVVLGVLRNQPAQMIYVGDKYQQIYEWRGAVNAMEAIDTDAESFLTTSFRFGTGIAEGATKLLTLLGENRPLRGNSSITSHIAPTPSASTVLARTNASTITAVIEALDAGQRPHLVGGPKNLMEMLRGVADLKRGEPSDVPEFFGFANWPEVVEFGCSDEGEHLRTFVNLVEMRGERQLMWALGRVAEADACDLVVSTAHKAKGREWPKVRLMDDFLKSKPRWERDERGGERLLYDPGELRLLYVALTRAKVSVEVPPPLLTLLGLSASQDAGAPLSAASPSRPEPTPETRSAVSHATPIQAEAPPVVQPAWVPPENWKPEPVTAPTEQPIQHRLDRPTPEPASRKRGGFLGWLLGR